ncbi:MAG: thiolase family protein [Planctomycetota bacterium]
MIQLNDAPPIVLAAGLRTPWARAGGAMQREDAGHLGARIAREVLDRAAIDPKYLQEVIAGCVGPPHDQANVARVIAIRAGVPQHVPAKTVARNCASGMEAVTSAVTQIVAGDGDLFLAMGVEVMSRYPLIFGDKMTALFAKLMSAKTLGQRLGILASFRPSFLKPRVALMEGLTDPTCGLLMGQTAELIARDFGVTREDADRYANESHRRARIARDSGRLAREILPLAPQGGKGMLEHDDSIRDNQSVEALAKMRPYFEKPDGIVTVANACGITDGAAALIVTTLDRAKALGLKPLARVRSFAWAGLPPNRMGLGPVYASAKALRAAGCRLSDIGVIELNEAFAAQVLACDRELKLPMDRVNVNGGSIALGHPIGATGARIVVTMLHEMARRDAKHGLATLCISGGMGLATAFHR